MKPYFKDYEKKCQAWIDNGAEKGAAKRLAKDLKNGRCA
jgi:hypothetical protein